MTVVWESVFHFKSNEAAFRIELIRISKASEKDPIYFTFEISPNPSSATKGIQGDSWQKLINEFAIKKAVSICGLNECDFLVMTWGPGPLLIISSDLNPTKEIEFEISD